MAYEACSIVVTSCAVNLFSGDVAPSRVLWPLADLGYLSICCCNWLRNMYQQWWFYEPFTARVLTGIEFLKSTTTLVRLRLDKIWLYGRTNLSILYWHFVLKKLSWALPSILIMLCLGVVHVCIHIHVQCSHICQSKMVGEAYMPKL